MQLFVEIKTFHLNGGFTILRTREKNLFTALQYADHVLKTMFPEHMDEINKSVPVYDSTPTFMNDFGEPVRVYVQPYEDMAQVKEGVFSW